MLEKNTTLKKKKHTSYNSHLKKYNSLHTFTPIQSHSISPELCDYTCFYILLEIRVQDEQ